jgi:hypothetical protein
MSSFLQTIPTNPASFDIVEDLEEDTLPQLINLRTHFRHLSIAVGQRRKHGRGRLKLHSRVAGPRLVDEIQDRRALRRSDVVDGHGGCDARVAHDVLLGLAGLAGERRELAVVVHCVDAEGLAAAHGVDGGFELGERGCGCEGGSVEAVQAVLEVGGEFELVDGQLEDVVRDSAGVSRWYSASDIAEAL